jgi:hypothetical protein
MALESDHLYLTSNVDGNNRSIMYEVEGVISPPYSLSQAFANSIPSVSTLMTNFFGHTQITTHGRLYCTNQWSSTAYMSIAGSLFTSPTSDSATLKYTNPTGTTETCFYAEGPAGQPFTNNVQCYVGRRAKHTEGGFTTFQNWATYSSQSISCDFNTYDYLWTIV